MTYLYIYIMHILHKRFTHRRTITRNHTLNGIHILRHTHTHSHTHNIHTYIITYVHT